MDSDRFWNLIDDARRQAADPTDADDVAARAVARLAGLEPAEILRAEQILWDLMAVSYLAPLWAAAY